MSAGHVNSAPGALPRSHADGSARWGTFTELAAGMPRGALVVMDERVARLHPAVPRNVMRTKPLAVVSLRAGERAKRMTTLERVLAAGTRIPRSGTVVCIGGGTIGDLATVAAHLLKRGVSLVQVPSTLLAAVDSSLGGKGAVHVRGSAGWIKNGAGVFHEASETWLCPELFTTLRPRQLREGRVEAWKMAVCLDAGCWDRWRERAPSLEELIREGRALKAEVCSQDPFERSGRRALLNFGHTFGHAFESTSGFRLSHGDAVALGVICALDIGVALGFTPPELRDEVEEAFRDEVGAPSRDRLARLLAPLTPSRLVPFLLADKKNTAADALSMVLLQKPGEAALHQVSAETWAPLWRHWKSGTRPARTRRGGAARGRP